MEKEIKPNVGAPEKIVIRNSSTLLIVIQNQYLIQLIMAPKSPPVFNDVYLLGQSIVEHPALALPSPALIAIYALIDAKQSRAKKV